MADGDSHDDLIRYGKVASIDLAAGRCVVATGDIVTQPVRWLELRAGNTRTWSPPTIGEQVLLLCPSGDIVGAIAVRGVPSDAFPPLADPDRELIRFKDGAIVAYNSTSHALEAILPGGSSVTITADDIVLKARVRVEGTLEVSETIDARGKITSTVDVAAGTVGLKGHLHAGVAAGQGFTTKPVA